MRRAPILMVLVSIALLGACAHKRPPKVSSTPISASQKTVDSMWAVAMDFQTKKKWSKAIVALERVELEMHPGDHRILLGRLYLGDMYTREGSNLEGVREYRRLSDEFPTDSLAPEALLRAGDAYRKLWRRPDLDDTYGFTAQSVYQELISRYTNAPATKLAEQRLNELENTWAMKRYGEGQYYMRFKAYDSAILIFKDLFTQWPHSSIAPSAVTNLVTLYRKLKQPEDAADMCGILRNLYPKTPKIDVTCPPTPPAAAAGKTKVP